MGKIYFANTNIIQKRGFDQNANIGINWWTQPLYPVASGKSKAKTNIDISWDYTDLQIQDELGK